MALIDFLPAGVALASSPGQWQLFADDTVILALFRTSRFICPLGLTLIVMTLITSGGLLYDPILHRIVRLFC